MRLLGVSEATIDNWTRRGSIPPPVRLGGPHGKRLWPVAAIERWLAEANGEVAHV
jgi:predicted DNA-binding transcriptional regulator AlpA